MFAHLLRRSRKLRLCNMKCIVPGSKPTDNLLMVAGARINPKWLDFLPAPAASQYIRSNFHQEIWNLGSLKYQRKKNENMKEQIYQTLGFWDIRLLALTVLSDDQWPMMTIHPTIQSTCRSFCSEWTKKVSGCPKKTSNELRWTDMN